MIKVSWDPSFLRAYDKCVRKDPQIKKKFWKALDFIQRDPRHPKLHTHKLTGEFKDTWAFSLGYDLRVIFKFRGSKEVQLIDIGSHDDVY